MEAGSSKHHIAVSTGGRSAPVEGAWSRRFRSGFDRSIKVSDWASGYANAVSAKVGGERFWPKSGDMPIEIEKCERILRAFTIEGIPQKEVKEEKVQDGKGNWITKKRRVLRKIPPVAIKNAKGVAIYSSMRSGIAPFGGGGGAGLVLVRLPDGSWSAPSAISPNNLSAGLLLGVDFIDAVLLINSDKALESFMSHKFTIGAETGLTAGPFGSGASAEAGFERAPIYSYVRTRGMYAGVEMMGQVFLHRFDENERFYYWPGISAKDILTGKVRMPPLVYPLHRALRDAEMGKAQGGKLDVVLYDVVKMPESEVMKMLGPKQAKKGRFVVGSGSTTNTPMSGNSGTSTPVAANDIDQIETLRDLKLDEDGQEIRQDPEREEDEDDEIIREGEKLRLPPTPEELELLERAGIPDEEDRKIEEQEREKVYQLPPPPMHVNIQRYWRVRPDLAAKRPTKQLIIDGPHSREVREAQFVRLPSSPRSSFELQEEAKRYEKEREALHIDIPEETNVEVNDHVLLSGVSEEEADRLMHAAASGEDATSLAEKVEMETLFDSEEDDGSAEQKGAEKNELAEAEKDAIKGSKDEQPSVIAAEDVAITQPESEIPTDKQEEKETLLSAAVISEAGLGSTTSTQVDGAEDKIELTSSPSTKASLALPSLLSSNEAGTDSEINSPRPSISDDTHATKSPPGRPPRNRPPPRRQKA